MLNPKHCLGNLSLSVALYYSGFWASCAAKEGILSPLHCRKCYCRQAGIQDNCDFNMYLSSSPSGI